MCLSCSARRMPDSPDGREADTRFRISPTIAEDRLGPLEDQEPAPLVLIQVKLLDGYGLSPLAIGASTDPRYSPRLRMMRTRQLRSLGAVGLLGFLLAVFISRGSAALDGLCQQPEDGSRRPPFDIVEPRATRLEKPRLR